MHNADQLVGVLWRRRLTFILIFVWVILAIAVVTYSLPKTYSTSAYLVITARGPATNNYEAQQVSQVDTQTAAELLGTRNTANLVASQLPYAASGKELQSRVDVSPVAQTQLVNITAHESSPLRAQQLASAYATTFINSESGPVGFTRVRLGESAPLISDPTSPRPKLYLLIGALLALGAAVAGSLVRDRLDRTLRIDDFDTEVLGLPILARVPERLTHRLVGERSAAAAQRELGFVESFHWVFANLALVSDRKRPTSIAVVSAGDQEGKSTVCVAMANAAQEVLSGGVLVVDGDLRRPVLAERFGVATRDERGLSDFLVGTGSEPPRVRGARRRHGLDDYVGEVRGSGIRLVRSGPLPPNPPTLLGLSSLDEFMTEARRVSEFVIFDTPPLSVGADASVIAAHTDGAVLVVDQRSSRRPTVEWSLEQLRRANVNVLGVIVNRARLGTLAYYDRHYRPDPEPAATPPVAAEEAGEVAAGVETEGPASKISSRV